MRAGVYVLVRTNGTLAENIWDDVLPQEVPEFFEHMRRDLTIGVAPRHKEQFAYFPVMAGDNLRDIAAFLVACSRS